MQAKPNVHLLLKADVDECKLGTHECNQICVNTVGSFMCDCYPGFILDINEYTCNGEFTINI